MRGNILTATSAIALGVAGAGGALAQGANGVAIPQTSGNIALWIAGATASTNQGGGLFYPDQKVSGSALGFGGDARGMYNFSAQKAIQVEIKAGGFGSLSDKSSKSGALYIAAGGHWINRYAVDRAWGVFAAVTRQVHAETYSSQASGNLIAGLQHAWLGSTNTFYVQLGGLVGIFDEGRDAEYWDKGLIGRAGLRHFYNDNLKVEAALAGGFGSITNPDFTEDEDDMTWFQLALELERKSASSPFSFYIAYQGDWVRWGDDESSETNSAWVNTFKVGARWAFGMDTLKMQNDFGVGTFTLPDLSVPSSLADALDY